MKGLLRRIGPYDDLRAYLRGLAVAAVAGAFLTLAGAFGTGDQPWARRLVYWMVLMGLGYVWGAFVARFFFSRPTPLTGNRWADGLAASLVMSTPFTAVTWLTSAAMFGGAQVARLPYMFI